MALSNISFEDISERDLQNLIAAGVPEGIVIDYKLQTYGRADADVREFLKDISSFANTVGGHLVIGMDESSGIPTQLAPLSAVDPDLELQRLESLARDGLEPRIVGLHMKTVPLMTGGTVIVIRIPKSWNPPHRVSARGINRIYARNSAGAYELSVEELRVLFASTSSAIDRVRAFRAQRLAHIDAGEAMTSLSAGAGRLVLHLVPLSSFGLGNQVDLERAHSLHISLMPIAAMGFGARFNFEGILISETASDGKCRSYTQLFRNGTIEGVKVDIINEYRDFLILPCVAFDKWIFGALPRYLSALRDLNVSPPIIFMLSLQGVQGAHLIVRRDSLHDPPPPFNRVALDLPEIMIENYGKPEEYQRAVRPAFDALWNAAGYVRSQHFDEQGRWTGEKQ